MIAVISSTIAPPDLPVYGGQRNAYSPAERLSQTIRTVDSLLDVGIEQIYLADNSGERWDPSWNETLRPARVHVYHQQAFKNKGISELYLLRRIIEEVPRGEPILKISGRYVLTRELRFSQERADVAAKFTGERRNRLMTTRCYLVRDSEVFARLVSDTLREVYAYSSRIVGPGSLLRTIRTSLRPAQDDYSYEDPPLSIEGASARVLAMRGYEIEELPHLFVVGQIGGVRDEAVAD